MFHQRFTPILVLSFLLLFGPATLSGAAEKTSVKVGTFPFRPFIFTDSDGSTQGINADLLNQIAKENNWQLSYQSGTWNDGLQRAKNRQLDIITSVMYTEERDSFLDYAAVPVFSVWTEVYARYKSHVEDVFALQGKKVAIMKGDLNAANFKQLAQSFNIDCDYIELPSHIEVFESVQQGTVTAGVAPNIFGLLNSSKFGLIRTPVIFAPKALYFCVPQGTNQELLKTINETLLRWKQDPESYYYQTLKRWLGGTSEQEIIPRWLLFSLLTTLLLLLSVFAWSQILKKQVKQHTKALAESENKFRTLFDEATVGLGMADANTGEILAVNETFANLLERPAEELIGKHHSLVHPEGRAKEQGQNSFQQHRTNKSGQRIESSLVTKSGRKLTVEIQAKAISFNGRDVMLASFIDISARKEAETKRQELELELRQKFKMEALGVMAGGMAHNFNNNMSIILGNIELAQMKLSQADTIYSLLDDAKTALLRSRELVKQILTYSRQQQTENKPLHLAPLVDETMKLLRSTIPSTIEMQHQIAPQAAEALIEADPTRIQEALINLCTNAAHAMEEKGKLSVILDQLELQAEEIPAQYQCRPGQFLCIKVQDNGCGISPENIEKIFDPFFTTKEVGEGTGMGLSTVRGIVEQHQGLIKVQSTINEGTEFQLCFPTVASDQTATESPENLLLRGSERILIVDDDELVIDVAQAMLLELGYRVTSLSDSPKALELVQSDPEAFDLVITDQTMPGLSGIELATQIKQIRPDLPIIILSGYSSKLKEEDLADLDVSAYFSKPLDIRELSQAVRQSLDR